VALPVARFIPLGFFAALALPRRRRRSKRYLYVVIPALLGAAGLAVFTQTFEERYLDPPGLATATADLACCMIGVYSGMSWVRGLKHRLMLVPKLGALILAVPLTAAALVFLSLDSAPLTPTVAADANPQTMRRVIKKFVGKNPKSLAPGATASLKLTERELNDVLVWAASTSTRAPHTQVSLNDEEEATVRMSVPSPFGGSDVEYLNITTIGSVGIIEGELVLRIRHLQVGAVTVPDFITLPLSRRIANVATRSQSLRPFLSPIRQLSVEKGAMTLTYGAIELPPSVVAALFDGDESMAALRQAATVHARHLFDLAEHLPPGDRKFGATLEAAFAFARERSRPGQAKQENEAALVALGMVLGHERLQRVVGTDISEAEWRRANAFRDTKVRSREDWPKHYFVSAAMTVLSSQGVGDAGGLLKEQFDADGGSGISLGDLLADRAGTSLAAAATADEASARAMQERLARGFHIDDFFPPASDLPENMTKAEFATRYGSVGSPKFREVTDDIERRLNACDAYRGHVVPALYEVASGK